MTLTPELLEVIGGGRRFGVQRADCLEWLAALPESSVDLVFGSPPYEQARLYLENGEDLDIARDTEQWVAWMVEVTRAALKACRGLVAWVVEGQTRKFSYSASPLLLAADLKRAGITLRKPPIYHRVGIPGSGGPDWLRNDYEFIICATNGGKLPWSDNTACGHTPVWEPGGEVSYRQLDGTRVNERKSKLKTTSQATTAKNGGGEGDVATVRRKVILPNLANPGNVVRCLAGGGQLGSPMAHENEAPFPLKLADFFVRNPVEAAVG